MAARRWSAAGGLADHHTRVRCSRETALRETAEALGFTHGWPGFAGWRGASATLRSPPEREACAVIYEMPRALRRRWAMPSAPKATTGTPMPA